MDVDGIVTRLLKPSPNGVIQGNDVFIILPTGSGKSLCYAIFPFAFDELRGCEGSLAIVVSPRSSHVGPGS